MLFRSIEKDAKYRECLKEVESLKAARNKLSKANGPLFISVARRRKKP